MNFAEAIVAAFTNAFNVMDRASRSEYWWFFVFCSIVSSLYLLFFGVNQEDLFAGNLEKFFSANSKDTSWSSMIFSLVLFVPYITLTIRRLHDTDRSGWNLVLGFIPLLGVFVLLVFMILPGTDGRNRFGPRPV